MSVLFLVNIIELIPNHAHVLIIVPKFHGSEIPSSITIFLSNFSKLLL